MTTTEIILSALAIVAITLLVTVYVSGERTIEAQQAVAAQKAIDAKAEQKKVDDENSQKTIDGLNAELDTVRAALAESPPRLMCDTSRSVRPNPTSAAPGRAVPGEPATLGSVPAVLGGATAGTDLGPSLQRFAAAAETVSAYARACQSWGIAQSK